MWLHALQWLLHLAWSESQLKKNKCSKNGGRLCMKFSSTLDASVELVFQPLFRNQYSLIVPPPLQRISPLWGQDQQNGKRIKRQLSRWYFRINLKDGSFDISIDPLGLYLSRNFVELSLHTIYPTMAVEYLCRSDYWKMHLWATKLKVDIFTHTPRQNPPRFLLSHSSRWKLLIPQGSGFLKFFSSPSRKGGKKLWINIKNNKNNLLMILRLFRPSNFLCKHFPKIHDNNFQFSRKKSKCNEL